jgi:sec-independent protein translocase protein TatC
VFNLMLFAMPMCLLFFVGVFASYLLVLHREGRSFPWGKILAWGAPIVIVVGSVAYLILAHFGFHFVRHWPFLSK